jgi:hypothetical protein
VHWTGQTTHTAKTGVTVLRVEQLVELGEGAVLKEDKFNSCLISGWFFVLFFFWVTAVVVAFVAII